MRRKRGKRSRRSVTSITSYDDDGSGGRTFFGDDFSDSRSNEGKTVYGEDAIRNERGRDDNSDSVDENRRSGSTRYVEDASRNDRNGDDGRSRNEFSPAETIYGEDASRNDRSWTNVETAGTRVAITAMTRPEITERRTTAVAHRRLCTAKTCHITIETKTHRQMADDEGMTGMRVKTLAHRTLCTAKTPRVTIETRTHQ